MLKGIKKQCTGIDELIRDVWIEEGFFQSFGSNESQRPA